ncbi:MAG: glycosyltransferase [bacterium]
MKISVISTVLNEGGNIAHLLEALAGQTLPPDEIIIVDAGSKDETVPLLRKYSSILPLEVLVCPGASRAEGRNSAIKKARGEIIASIDAGCVPARDWLENLVAPFQKDPSVDVVAGYYEPIIENPFQEALASLIIPSLNEISPLDFLPSSRSVAFKKAVWENVGGYPQWMKSAEDTVFDLSLKKAGARFVFQPKAIVKWHLRNSLKSVFKQFYEYSFWDAKAGVFFPHYNKIWLYLLGVFLLLLSFLFRPFLYLFLLCFSLYIFRALLRARRRRNLSWKAYLWFIPVLFAYDLGNIIGYTIGKLKRR